MASLILQDGSEFRGIPFGARRSTNGEVGKRSGWRSLNNQLGLYSLGWQELYTLCVLYDVVDSIK